MSNVLEVYKYLPKKNCGECGVPTCLAFAMKLVNSNITLEKCPYLSDDAKQLLTDAYQSPIRKIILCGKQSYLTIGDETELFRHEKRFNNPTAYGVVIDDISSIDTVKKKTCDINQFKIDRIGESFSIDLVAIKNVSGNVDKFTEVIETVERNTNLPVMFISDYPEIISTALEQTEYEKVLIGYATEDNFNDMIKITNKYQCVLAVSADTIDKLSDLTEKITAKNINDIVINLNVNNIKNLLEGYTIIRKVAVKKRKKSLGYPILTTVSNKDNFQILIEAGIATLKYSSIILFENISYDILLPLFVLRQNIYSDPQKPVKVKSGLYKIGNPDEYSPVLVTTNFSLTYFSVLNDIEKSGIPAWLLVTDTEGLSVLTAFAAGKFTPESISELIKETDIYNKVLHRRLIIPGAVARITQKLSDITDLDVIPGPVDSSGLVTYLRQLMSGGQSVR